MQFQMVQMLLYCIIIIDKIDVIWQNLVLQSYVTDANISLPWFKQFKRLRSQWYSFDPNSHPPSIELDKSLRIATARSDSYLPLLGGMGVTNGKHSFFLKVGYGTRNIGIGIGNNKVPATRVYEGYVIHNHGIGWYLNGNCFRFGQMKYEKLTNSTYETGDVVGFFLDMDAKEITFYKNGIMVFPPMSILPDSSTMRLDLVSEEEWMQMQVPKLYPFLVLEIGSKVEILRRYIFSTLARPHLKTAVSVL